MKHERWSQIERIYHQALEREPRTRGVFLRETCANDQELLREVESLLERSTEGFLSRPVVQVGAVARNDTKEQAQGLVGRQLGTYQVIAKIGEGGMGEVYRAKDTKLGREVAIKVLPAEFTKDAERLARFRREAKLLASLNHHNIAMLFGLEDSGEIHFLVMELVEGKNLSERLAKGALPVPEALNIGEQIAEALDHAHGRKVIHRDLKPGNLIVTPMGRVKVLDFGLAKALADEVTDSPEASTLSLLPTGIGRIMGTPAYMSPEQAQGEPVNQQTDIWAFGCILYELLTGRRAFPGENISQTIASVLRSDPDWSALPVDTPTRVREILHLCLEKEVSRRRRDIGDVRLELEKLLQVKQPTVFTPTTAGNVWSRKTLGAVIALILLVVAGLATSYLKPKAPQPVMHLNMNVTPAERLVGLACPIVTLSPDGTRVAFIGTHAGVRQLFVRALDKAEGQPIAGTEGAFCTPEFSPDGQWIAFYADGKLKKIPYGGGTATVLLPSIYGMSGMSWGDDNNIVFSSDENGLQRISASGGSAKFVTKVDRDKGERVHVWPQVLPGAKAMIYTIASGERAEDSQIVAQSFASGERRVLIQGGSFGSYVPAGYLVYLDKGVMRAVRFDPDLLKVTGDLVPASEDVLQSERGAAQFAFSRYGSLVYVPASQHVNELAAFVWVDRKGQEEQLPVPPGAYEAFSLSPDGRRLAFQLIGLSETLSNYDFDRNAVTNFGQGYSPRWTHDGMKLIFAQSGFLFWKPADGSGKQEQITPALAGTPTSISPDGRSIALWRVSATTGQDIFILSLDGERTVRPWLQTPANEAGASFSPDGRWIAYVSNESGRYEVYVRQASGDGEKTQVSSEGGGEPLWAPNGKELFYRNGDKMMVVPVSTGSSFKAGQVQLLFQASYLHQGGRFEFASASYQVASDGQKFLMMKRASPNSGATQIDVVLNWFEELKQKASSR